MFFRKSERKSHRASFVLVIGALAAIGAVSITRCGKQMLCCMKTKMKSLFDKEKSMCEQPQDSQ